MSNKKTIRAWTFYDWANSAYPLVISSAIFPIFFEAVTSTKDASGKIVSDIVQLFGYNFKNTELYSYVISFSFLIVSMLSPLLSGIADYSGNKKMFMKFFCYMGAIATSCLYFFNVEHLALSMLTVMLASIGFWSSLVFYNAFLPEIAPPQEHDKISARGYAMGYFGSALLLIINLIAIQKFAMPARWAFVSVGIWWVGFAQITYRNLPETKHHNKEKANIFKGFNELKLVWKNLENLPNLKKYLTSFFVYSMGVQTIMIMAVLFAKKEIHDLKDADLIISVLLIQFVGILGSYTFSWLSKKLGNIKALMVAVFIWILICVGTYSLVYHATQFYIVAASVGMVMGGIQSLSRSTYSKLLPETDDHASYFSFYDVCEKVGIIIGTFAFGFIEGITGGMRNSILSLIVFFIVGMLLLFRVKPLNRNVQV